MPFAPADDSAPLASHRGKRGKMTDAEKKREDALRDAVVGLQRGIGIEVNTDWKEGQKVLDVDRKRQARMMGTTTRNRQKLIGKILSEKETTKTQEAIVSVFSGKSQVETIAFEDASKKQRLIRFVQGHDQKAGVKHSVVRHYGTNKNGYTADELLLIPDVLSRGLRKQDGNRVSYSLDNDGVKYTVTTLQKSTGEEIFTNFYTNKN